MNPELLDRLPPQDLTAEQQVLGAAIMDPRICDELATLLSSGQFYAAAHATIYDVLMRMHDTQTPISPKTFVQVLQQRGELERVGGVATLADIVNSVAVSKHYAYHAGIVVAKAKRRDLIHAASEMLRDCWDETEDVAEIINRQEQVLSRITSGQAAAVEAKPISSVMLEAMAHIDKVAERNEGIGILTGFDRFDEQIGGLFPSELIVLAARPGVGKTAMACQVTSHIGTRRPVYFASLEMAGREIAMRMLCTRAEVNSQRIRTASLNREERERLSDAANKVATLNVTLDARPRMTVMDIRRAARKVHRREGHLGLVVVDYLTLLTPTDEKKKRYEQVGDVAKELKALAGELETPVLALAQLNRDIDKTGKNGEARKPRMADLRESGEIEQVADMIIFLHRQAVGYRATESRHAELLIEKNRNGVTKGYKLDWTPEYTRYAMSAQQTEEPEPERDEHWE